MEFESKHESGASFEKVLSFSHVNSDNETAENKTESANFNRFGKRNVLEMEESKQTYQVERNEKRKGPEWIVAGKKSADIMFTSHLKNTFLF